MLNVFYIETKCDLRKSKARDLVKSRPLSLEMENSKKCDRADNSICFIDQTRRQKAQVGRKTLISAGELDLCQ